MELFAAQSGIKLTHVPYKGASQAALGVAGGDVPVAFQGLATVATLARGGKLRLIGLSTPAPLAEFPGVPLVSESGLPGFQFNSWFTVVAPAGTPKDIVAKLHAEIVKALADPDVRARLKDQGLTARGTSPEELRTATREQLARYAKLIKDAGIKAE
jgi:tripartite-type tricarboxylate transporter receptor subunit TctC